MNFLKKLFEKREFVRVYDNMGFFDEVAGYSYRVMRESFWTLELYHVLVTKREGNFGINDFKIINKWEHSDSVNDLMSTFDIKKQMEDEIAENKKPRKDQKVNLIELIGGKQEYNRSGFKVVQRFPRLRKQYQAGWNHTFSHDIEGHNPKVDFPEYFI